MGEVQIENAPGAFQPLIANEPIGDSPSATYRVVQNTGSTAIAQYQWVATDITGTGAHIYGVIQGLHGGVPKDCVGIAIEAIAVNGFGRIIVDGPCIGLAGAAGVTAGNQLTPSTVSTDDGQLIASSGTVVVGTVIGIALTTQATHGGQFEMWVSKS